MQLSHSLKPSLIQQSSTGEAAVVPMRRSDAACIFKQAIPAQVFQILIQGRSESRPTTQRIRSFDPIVGLLVVIEACISLNVILDKVDFKEVNAAEIGVAVDSEFGVCASCGDVGLA